jgi:hypothetical protein
MTDYDPPVSFGNDIDSPPDVHIGKARDMTAALNTVYLSSDGPVIVSVKLTITAGASGFEVDRELRYGGQSPQVKHIDVFRTRELAVAALKAEAAAVAQAFVTGQMG